LKNIYPKALEVFAEETGRHLVTIDTPERTWRAAVSDHVLAQVVEFQRTCIRSAGNSPQPASNINQENPEED
jgi:hypothetical protein